jgi:hypothetical protein
MFLHGYGADCGRFATLNRLLRTDRFVPPLVLLALVVCAGAACGHRAEAAGGPLRVATVRL